MRPRTLVPVFGVAGRFIRRGQGASALAFGTQPQAVAAGGTLASFTVEIRKASGAVDTSRTDSITISKASGSGTLGGTLVAVAVAGVATFSATSFSGTFTDSSHTLTATATGLTSATSDAFVIYGGNRSYSSAYLFYQDMLTWPTQATPLAGGTLALNSVAMGSYDYIKPSGNQTVSAFTSSDWFTATADSRSAWVVVPANLTINSGQVFKPANRKLFTAVGVSGTLDVSGELSMSARGAYHGAAGGNVAAGALRIIAGTHGGVTNPEIPAAGGGGGAAKVSGTGNAGTAGVAGGCGGGGSGGGNNTGSSGAGAAATSFGGGPGGGGIHAASPDVAESGTASGGPGGAAFVTASGNRGCGGGAGNDGGAAAVNGTGTAAAGGAGTGGVLLAFCATLTGAGTITAAGAAGGETTTTNGRGGGGSGAGSATVMYDADASSITPTATGGAGGAANGPSGSLAGGAGGAGTARKLLRAA